MILLVVNFENLRGILLIITDLGEAPAPALRQIRPERAGSGFVPLCASFVVKKEFCCQTQIDNSIAGISS